MSDAPAQGAPPAREKRRRQWRIAVGLAALLVMLLIVVGTVVWTYLHSRAGGVQLRDRTVAALNGLIQGHLEAGSVTLSGQLVVLRDLNLYDPEGQLVAHLDEVDARLSLFSLARRRVVVTDAQLHRLKVHLEEDARGLNLTRALESRHPSEPGPPSSPSPWSVDVRQFALDGGDFDYDRRGETEDRHAAASQVRAEGSFQYEGPKRSIGAKVRLDAAVDAPVAGPLTVEAQWSKTESAHRIEATVSGPGAFVSGNARVDLLGESFHVEALRLDPASAREIFGSWPLKVPVELSGELGHRATAFRADVHARAGGAALSLKGSYDVALGTVHGLSLHGTQVDLRALTGLGPPGVYTLDLTADGGGRRLEELEGELELTIPSARLPDGGTEQQVGPVHLVAKAHQGKFTIPELRVSLPGLSLSGSGSGDVNAFTFDGMVHAKDLARLTRVVGNLTEQQVPPLAGNGSLKVHADGPLRHPMLRVDGVFPVLRTGEVEARSLAVHARIPDVIHPLEAEGTVTARSLRLGTRAFRNLEAEIATEGRHLHVDASAKGLADVVLHVAGLLDPDHNGFSIDELALRYPEAEWALEAPSHLRFENGIHLAPLSLVSGDQRLRFAIDRTEVSLTAGLDLLELDLARLPRALVAPELGVAGRLNASAHATGAPAHPSVTLDLHIAHGAFQRWQGVEVALQGSYARDRAQGTLQVTHPVLHAAGSFDFSPVALARRRVDPVRAELDIGELELAELEPLLGLPANERGRIRGQLLVAGTARDPLVRATVHAHHLQSRRVPAGVTLSPDVDLTLESGAEGRLGLHVDAEAATSTAELALRTPYTVPQLLTRLPTNDELRRAPMELELALRDVDASLAHALGYGPELTGHLSLRAEARGALVSPTINARLDGVGISGKNLARTDLAATFVGDDRQVNASLTGKRGKVQVANIVAQLNAPMGKLLEPDAMPTIPLELEGNLGPVGAAELQALGEPQQPSRRSVPRPSASVSAHLHGEGTLSDPRLELKGRLEDIRVNQGCVGRAEVAWQYRSRVSTATVTMQSHGNGRLEANATTTVDLSWPALRHGQSFANAPLQGHLEAQGFDLAVLNGLIPMVREIGGQLSARAAVTGTLGAPNYQGAAQLVDGVLSLQGYGEYRNVRARMSATNDRYQLSELTAVSGGGTAHLVALAQRSGAQFTLAGSGSLDRFPIISDDQTVAVLTTHFSFDGDASRPLINIRRLHIPEAHIDLPQASRKDLQEIDRPNGIIITRGDVVLEKPKATEEARLSATPGTAEAQELSPPHDVPGEEEEAVRRQYWITVDAPSNLMVRSVENDVNAELGFSEGFRVELTDRASLFGDIRVLRGRVVVLGRKFDVQSNSTARFSGAAKRAYVDASAVWKNEREGVTVTVTVRGVGKDITLRPTSEPPLSESEIYTLIATGRRTLKRDSGTALSGAQAASTAVSFLTNEFRRTISSKIPLDVLSFEGGEDGIAGSRVEAGTYITDQVYVGYSGRIGANTAKENANAVRIEYQVSPHISLEGECGDARVCGADVFWTRDF